MSLVRQFTKRARAQTRGEESSSLPRSCTVKYAPGTINRAKISLPTELISTTNVEALNAPDIKTQFSTSSKASSSSDSISSDNDFSSIDKGFLSADNSSTADLSPITPYTPMSDIGVSSDAKDFFSIKTGPSFASSMAAITAVEPTPAIPARAPSHSKRAHVELSRQLSFKRSLSPPPTTLTQPTTYSSDAIYSPTLTASPPKISGFNLDLNLGKVDESVLDEEEQEMMSKGLRKFTVNDYLAEITGMNGGVYVDRITLNPWI